MILQVIISHKSIPEPPVVFTTILHLLFTLFYHLYLHTYYWCLWVFNSKINRAMPGNNRAPYNVYEPVYFHICSIQLWTGSVIKNTIKSWQCWNIIQIVVEFLGFVLLHYVSGYILISKNEWFCFMCHHLMTTVLWQLMLIFEISAATDWKIGH